MDSKKPNYFVRHWRGELSLSVSFWGNVVFLNILVTIISRITTFGGFLDGISWQTAQIVVISLLLFAVVIGVWQIVGTWRSATRYRANGGSRVITGIVKLLMAFGALSLIGNLGIAIQDFNLRTENAKNQDFDVYVSENGYELVITGEIGVTISDTVVAQLEQYKAIDTLVLNSHGGDLNETFRIIHALDRYRDDNGQKITTYVDEYCASACSILFISGDKRILAKGAKLGFHQLQSYVTVDPDTANIERLQRKVSNYFQLQGVSPAFVRDMYQAAPDDMWYPTEELLLTSNVVHHLVERESMVPTSAPTTKQTATQSTETTSELDVVALIRDISPVHYEELERQLESIPNDGNHKQNVELTISNFVSNLKLESLRRVDDGLLLDVIENETALYNQLAEHAPDLCMQTLYPGEYGYPDYERVMHYRDGALFAEEITRIFEQGLRQELPTIDYEMAYADLEHVLATINQDISALDAFEASNKGYRLHCQSIAHFYAYLAKALPETRAANLVRYIIEPE
ncbi:hypothetical protein [Pseudidiomarina sp.]|uniref:COG3904 family protein n=1 Tax=Pseudidiomarina sp. TaxID=2081707 RepID=UPI003A98436E